MAERSWKKRAQRVSVSLCALSMAMVALPACADGYRPFFGPAPIERYWLWLLVPLVVGVAIVYRTIKSDDLAEVPRRAAYLTFQVAAFMLAAAVVLWVTLRLF